MPYAKAIVAFITPILLAPLVVLGIEPETTVESAVSILLMAVFSALSVYFTPNKQ